jgi:hypothetical protein
VPYALAPAGSTVRLLMISDASAPNPETAVHQPGPCCRRDAREGNHQIVNDFDDLVADADAADVSG